MLVSLTQKEVAQCNQAAAMRWQLARASGVVNQRRDKGRSDADLDLLGVKAELAVSKVFDLDHIHAVGVDDGRDVWLDNISIDVKATFYSTGRLLFKKREAFKADCSILVCQQAPDRMHVVGYILFFFKQKTAYEIDLGHGKGWAMDQENLLPLERLWGISRSIKLKESK